MKREKRGLLASIVATLALALVPFSCAFAERMIVGTVTTMSGQPAAGFLVRAFDQDGATEGDDDRMGQDAITDASGRYSIGPYDDKHWDTKVAGSNSWRPDIFVRVYQPGDGRWIFVKKSATAADHRMKETLTIDVRLTGVWGVVRDDESRPIAGVTVKAYDHDALPHITGPLDQISHDLIAEAVTGRDGRFEMLYESKDWDTRIPTSTSWRPDIFVEMHGEIRGRTIKINKGSRVASDWPHHKNLYVSEAIRALEQLNYSVPMPGRGTLNVLAYNVYLRPRTTFADGQTERVPYIADEILRDQFDVVVLCETFDDRLRTELRHKLAERYPYDARVPDSFIPAQDGGVKILSRWPIENGSGEFRLFGLVTYGLDAFAQKGVVYVRIAKEGRRYHIFGTHLQADATYGLLIGLTPQGVRRTQLAMIRAFIDEKNIPADEAVIIAGDMNVDMYSYGGQEYRNMLETLGARHPPLEGLRYSVDETLNDLGGNGGQRQLLDYVLYSARHRQPIGRPGANVSATNRVLFYRANEGWAHMIIPGTVSMLWDISDHYPVLGSFQFELDIAPAQRDEIVPPTTEPMRRQP